MDIYNLKGGTLGWLQEPILGMVSWFLLRYFGEWYFVKPSRSFAALCDARLVSNLAPHIAVLEKSSDI